ncbi:uncharacterized protein LOC143210838 [Lasioglossum baleicum]|uniref:uncharacterized protein LOC143210838 n=1 Tax=Lasioglossum baleicum TaxID=434251 RepID=UPI003FCE0240
MSNKDIIKQYVLSQYAVEKLKPIKEALEKNMQQADSFWTVVIGEEKNEMHIEEVTTDESDEDDDNGSSAMPNCTQHQSTQFYCTQFGNDLDREIRQTAVQKCDIVECIFESLERPNGKLDVTLLEDLNDEEFLEVVRGLEKKLSMTGTCNICCSLNNMSTEDRMKYTSVFYTDLLLPKIIVMEGPSRMLLSVIVESVQKFPDDIQKFIFVPLLNIDLKDTTIVNVIANTFEYQRSSVLISEYLLYAKELKLWHLPVLHNLMSVRLDDSTKQKFIQLISEKALEFSKEKNFGKLVLLFIKINVNFSEQQKFLLQEIANINQTFFKKPIQNMLKDLL